jgi:hypothetical protein
MIHGGQLEKPIYMTNWSDNLAFMHTVNEYTRWVRALLPPLVP